MESNRKHLVLFLLRHGEREDEAEPSSDIDSLDPYLTARGRSQARLAWEKLLAICENKKVLICSSPLKRCLATASLSASLPNSCYYYRPRDSTRTEAVPIVVINSLGNAAAACQSRGGVDRILEEEPNIIPGGVRRDQWEIRDTDLFRDDFAVQDKIEFWGWYGGDSWKDPVYMKPQPSGGSFEPAKHKKPPKIGSSERDKAFLQSRRALNEAVRLALEGDCDICIIVSHREAIHDLASNICAYSGRIRTPYCCVSTHLVCSGRYQFHGILDTGDVSQRLNIPKALNFGPLSDDRTVILIDGRPVLEVAPEAHGRLYKLGPVLRLEPVSTSSISGERYGGYTQFDFDITQGQRQWSKRLSAGQIHPVLHDPGSNILLRARFQRSMPSPPPLSLEIMLES